MLRAITACRAPAWDAIAWAVRKTLRFSNIGASPSIGFNQGLTLIPLEIVFRRFQESSMLETALAALKAEIAALEPDHCVGRVAAVEGELVRLTGLSRQARLGDMLRLRREGAPPLTGEVLQLTADHVTMLPDETPTGVFLGQPAVLERAGAVAPDDGWVGRIIDPFGKPLDGRPILRGAEARPLRAAPPAPARRRPLGARLETGMAAFNTLLPVVQGQRIGLFAGSGVGKTSLLGHLARNVEADVV